MHCKCRFEIDYGGARAVFLVIASLRCVSSLALVDSWKCNYGSFYETMALYLS